MKLTTTQKFIMELAGELEYFTVYEIRTDPRAKALGIGNGILTALDGLVDAGMIAHEQRGAANVNVWRKP